MGLIGCAPAWETSGTSFTCRSSALSKTGVVSETCELLGIQLQLNETRITGEIYETGETSEPIETTETSDRLVILCTCHDTVVLG